MIGALDEASGVWTLGQYHHEELFVRRSTYWFVLTPSSGDVEVLSIEAYVRA